MFTKRTAGAAALSKVIIVAVVAAAISGVVMVKRQTADGGIPSVEAAQSAGGATSATAASEQPEAAAALTEPTAEPKKSEEKKLPRLVDLGAGKCIPCRAMKPILDSLREEYKGKFDVVFIDVWENREAGPQYGIRVIPTQIFYDETGKERFRHEGFYGREDILKTWKNLGYAFD